MIVDPALEADAVPGYEAAVARTASPGEQLLGLFAITRLRHRVSLLAVTSARLLTLRQQDGSYVMVDEIHHHAVREVVLDKAAIFRWGEVRVVPTMGPPLFLGTLASSSGGRVLDLLDEALGRARDLSIPPLRLDRPPLPVPGTGTGGAEVLPAEDDQPARHEDGQPDLDED